MSTRPFDSNAVVTLEQDVVRARRRLNVVRIVAVVVAGIVVLLAVLNWYDARTSRIQARLASRYASRLTFSVQPGPTDSVVYPVAGPFDLRRGYVRLPGFTDTLLTQGYEITAQARFSPE